MKRKHKWLAGILILSAAIAVIACAKPAPTVPGTEPETTTGPDPKEDSDVRFTHEGKALYQIVRPEEAGEALKEQIISFRREVERKTGVRMAITSDFLSMDEKGYERRCEILIGKTGYPESKAALETCGYGDWIIRAVGNKIVVTAYDDGNLAAAMDALCRLIAGAENPQELTLTREELTVTRSVNATVSALPRYTGSGTPTVIDCADGAYQLLVEEASRADWDGYVRALEDGGFTRYTAHTVGDNSFATYTNDGYTVTMYHTPVRGQLRAMIEPRGALPPMETEAHPVVCTPSVTLVGLEYDNNQIGLGMIFRLSDGSFLIFDGGNNKSAFADRFYAKLCELAPDPEHIRVRGWFFSHCHTDHVGTFIRFTDKYREKVTVDRFIYNFGTDAVYDTIVSGANRGLSAELRAAVGKWTDSQVIKAHTGQRFRFADAEVEMLYTGEDVYPLAWRDGNTESLVFRVTLGGQTILCLGDEYLDSSEILSAMYGTYLKSDILQASHHGRNGATVTLNSQIQPDTVLWPGGTGAFFELSQREYNVRLLAICKDLYVAGKDGVTLELPYTVQNNKEQNRPKP